jgi:hypothetical protein
MSKEEVARHEIVAEANPNHPIVAEGTGKTAGNEGAKQKEVYNVCPLLFG